VKLLVDIGAVDECEKLLSLPGLSLPECERPIDCGNTLHSLARGYSIVSDFAKARETLNRIRDAGFEPRQRTFRAILEAYGEHTVHQILEYLKTSSTCTTQGNEQTMLESASENTKNPDDDSCMYTLRAL
jgi:hypothetical protein